MEPGGVRPARQALDGRGRGERTAQILVTVSRYGLSELMRRRGPPQGRAGGGAAEPAGLPDWEGAARLRGMFEALGPSFVKIGQLLAMHAWALPEACREQLSRLLDSTLPLAFPVIEGVLADELGGEWRARFEWLAPEPLASASIGQVHKGRLATGAEVAVKVQRPGAREVFERDFAIVRNLVRYTRLHSMLHMTRPQLNAIVEEIITFTRAEFDYCH